MEGFTYNYGFGSYPVFGMDLDHARKNAVLEAFIRFHDEDPKIGMKLQQGTDYASTDKFNKRADTLIGYIQDDIKFPDNNSRYLMEALKQAYFSTKSIEPDYSGFGKQGEQEVPRFGKQEVEIPKFRRIPFFKDGRNMKYYLNAFKMLPETRRSRRCSGLLAGEDCYVALAAQSRDPLVILGYPKIKYEILKGWYCATPNQVPKLDADYPKRIKYEGKEVVSIGGVRSKWQRRGSSSGYHAQPHCAAIVDAVRNYDLYLELYTNLDTTEREDD